MVRKVIGLIPHVGPIELFLVPTIAVQLNKGLVICCPDWGMLL